AMEDYGLKVTEENSVCIGAAIGSGIGGLIFFEKNHSILMNCGPQKISPSFVPSTIVNMITGYLSIKYGLRGLS
ncbi:MAG: beta-ketoacyl synthase N-terminal-like domain-containing protein, partial [Candidatus Regiella insecticola]|nr:beta-ketoacyl synthase N-terminal-like domain-containing protein [Candidatus Regiella insecticola]